MTITTIAWNPQSPTVWLILQLGFILVLFLLVYMAVQSLMLAVAQRTAARDRLAYVRESAWSNRIERFTERYGRLHRHLADLLESIQSRWSIGWFLYGTVLLTAAGVTAGALLFGSLKGSFSLGLVLGSIPYVALRMKLLTLQMRVRLEFLPAVELFYQYYLVSGGRNIRTALRVSLEESRMLYPMKGVFAQLHHNLATSRSVDDSLRIMTVTLGHHWALYLANILRVGLTEGNEVADSLRELIQDMRRAQRADQAERNRLLEIRLASFTSILFLLLFLGINFKLNFTNAWRYYVEDPDGRNMVLDGCLLIFGSFMMGIYLSIRRM